MMVCGLPGGGGGGGGGGKEGRKEGEGEQVHQSHDVPARYNYRNLSGDSVLNL